MRSIVKLAVCLNLFLSALIINTVDAKTNKKGWRESYGGDSSIAEFKSLGREILFLAVSDNENKYSLNWKYITKTISDLSIECQSNLKMDGVSKDAINYPFESPQRLLLDCHKWTNDLSYNQKKILVIHELLPLLGQEDFDYSKSSEIVELYNKNKIKKDSLDRPLLSSVIDCNPEAFHKLISDGANVYLKPPTSLNLLSLAIRFNCPILTRELLKYRYLSIDDDAIFRLIIKNFEGENIDVLNLTKIINLIKPHYPNSIKRIGFNEDYFFISAHVYDLRIDCLEKSNVLHFLASKKPEQFTRNYFSPFQKGLIQKLVELGFDPDAVNKCGDNPRQMFKAKGLILK